MKALIVIPTYWTSLKEINESVFDHPTPLRGAGTLERCLKSMQDSGIEEEIVVFPSPTSESVEKKVEKIISGFDELNIDLFTGSHLRHIINFLRKGGFPRDFTNQFNMNSYPNIRNMCFAMANLKKADLVIQIDDDVIIEDRNFIENAAYSIGRKVSGKGLLGKTGFYVNRKGDWRIRQQHPRMRRLWLKEMYINQALKRSIQSGERLAKTTIALGGNMVIHRELFKGVPYDPYNTRGEDTDYLINCRYFGHNFLFDNRLKVKHIQPKRIAPYWTKMRQDIYRFVYLREKLSSFKMRASGLDPYPGAFLKEDLEERIASTCANYANLCLSERRLLDGREWTRNSTEILEEARRRARKFGGAYLDFQKSWKRFMRVLN